MSLLLLAVPMVGCADGGDGGGDLATGEDGMRAQEGADTARSVAEEWSSEAVLIGAGTLETNEDGPEEWPADAPEFRSDDEVGDGFVPQWSYTFKDGEDRMVVYVREDGETYQGPEPQEDSFMDAEIADWELDSADAVEAAKEESENFSATVDADDAEVGYFLMGNEDGDEAWLLDARSEANDEQVTVTVNAQTGEVERFAPGG